MYVACTGKDGIDANTYMLLRTSIDLDGLHDLLEMRQVSASWDAAMRRNIDDNKGKDQQG